MALKTLISAAPDVTFLGKDGWFGGFWNGADVRLFLCTHFVLIGPLIRIPPACSTYRHRALDHIHLQYRYQYQTPQTNGWRHHIYYHRTATTIRKKKKERREKKKKTRKKKRTTYIGISPPSTLNVRAVITAHHPRLTGDPRRRFHPFGQRGGLQSIFGQQIVSIAGTFCECEWQYAMAYCAQQFLLLVGAAAGAALSVRQETK